MGRASKRFLPRSLFGRLMLIMLVPLLVLNGVALQIFYGSHLDLVSRRLSGAVAGEIGIVIDAMDRWPQHRAWWLREAHQRFDLDMQFRPNAKFVPRRGVNVIGPADDDLRQALAFHLHRRFNMDWTSDPRQVLLHIQLRDGVLDVKAPRKRLDTGTIYLFLSWLVGVAALMFGIAAWFVRRQVRAIGRLARAAEAFGLGEDPGLIKPEGAVEVRRAATAFNRMQERIRRFLAQRTEMLAGVSHDLRTPLTRLRLNLAMLPQHPDIPGMETDLDEMERMIDGYLAFARGERLEQAALVPLAPLLEDLAEGARRAGIAITVFEIPSAELRLRQDAVRRAIANLIDNAGKHAHSVGLSAEISLRAAWILVDDDGPGIPPDQREGVFRPFESGAAGGTGLGLTIARDIIRAHGGDIMLEDSPMGGLRARVRLPLAEK